ncbi:MAG: hypothetical protein IJ186_02180 [Bacilli bacterium]|nr:hypothetical protein [Bacilli bacterium]
MNLGITIFDRSTHLVKHVKKSVVFVSAIFVAIIANFFQFSFLSDLYFRDSNLILSMIYNSNYNSNGEAFIITAHFFSFFYNVFHFKNLIEWNIFLAILLNPFILSYIYISKKQFSYADYFFYLATVFLLNIFVFTVAKEVLQFFMFFLLFLIVRFLHCKKFLKYFLIFLVILLESIFFRNYFIIMLGLFLLLLLVSSFFKKNFVFSILVSIIILFIGIYICKFIFPSQYDSIFFVREISSAYLNANTEINNLIPLNNSFLNFVLNYFINFLRLMFPLELISKGIVQIFFTLYQIYLSISVFLIFLLIRKNRFNLKKEYYLFFLIFLSYLFCSAFFEPDFGSFVRHESSGCFVFMPLLYSQKELINEKN